MTPIIANGYFDFLNIDSCHFEITFLTMLYLFLFFRYKNSFLTVMIVCFSDLSGLFNS